MQLSLTTPALFFPAISLLFLSYTNKFLALAALVRSLHHEFETNPNCPSLTDQIEIIHRRLMLIKHMQGLGILSFIFCVLDMFFLYLGLDKAGLLVFGGCLLFLLASLLFCAVEIHISTEALDVQLHNMEKP